MLIPTRRWWLWALLLTAPAWIYLVGVNLVLAIGLDWMIANPNQIQIHYQRAWSLWPGRAEVRDLRLTFQDRNVQFSLDIARASLTVAMLELPRQVFHATKVRADGVVFRMRHRLDPLHVDAPWVRALAPIHEFRDPPVFEATVPEAPVSDADYALWTVHLEDVDAQATELWVQFVRYIGLGRARGAFRLKPDRALWVGRSGPSQALGQPALLDLSHGRVTIGDDELIHDLSGRLACQAHPFDVRVPHGLEVFRNISAELELKGEGVTLDRLPHWFTPQSEIELRAGPSRLAVSVSAHRGVAEPGSTVELTSDELTLEHGKLTSAAHELSLRASALDDGRGVVELALGKGELALRAGQTLPGPQFRGVTGSLVVSQLDAAEPAQVLSRLLEIEHFSLPEARWLSRALALQSPRIDGGRIDGQLLLEEERGLLGGRARLHFEQLRAHSGELYAATSGDLSAQLKHANEKRETGEFELSGSLSALGLRDGESDARASHAIELAGTRVSVSGQRDRRGLWSGTLRAAAARGRGHLQKLALRLEPSFTLSARDFDPAGAGALHGDLQLRRVSLSSLGVNDDCPWLSLPSARLVFDTNAAVAQSVRAELSAPSFAFGWGDFRGSGGVKLAGVLAPAAGESARRELGLELSGRRVELESGAGDGHGWQASIPQTRWRAALVLEPEPWARVEGLVMNGHGRIGHTQIASDVSARVRLTGLDLARGQLHFGGTVATRHTAVRAGKESVDDWWAQIDVGSGLMLFDRNVDLSALFHADLRDATPALAVLAASGDLPGVLTQLVPLRGVSVTGMLQRRCQLTDILFTQASGGPLSARGRLHSSTDSTRAAFLVRLNGFAPISAGVALTERGAEVSPLVGDDWLAARTAGLERQAQQVLDSPCPQPPAQCSAER